MYADGDAQARLNGALQATKSRLKLIWGSTAAGVWLAASILFALVFVVCDHWLPGGLSDPLRGAISLSYQLASAAWLGMAVARPLVRRINDLYAARLIERSRPELRNALVDALQIGHHRELPGSVRAAVLDQAARQVAEVDVRRTVPTRRLRRTAAVSLTALAMFGLYTILSPKPVLPSLLRLFDRGIAPPTLTAIAELTPTDGTSVLRGEPVTFTALFARRIPPTALVRFSRDHGRTWLTGEQLDLAPAARGQLARGSSGGAGSAQENGAAPRPGCLWSGVKAGLDVQQSMHWQLVAGDTQSEIRRLDVRPLPEITAVNLQYDYPKYTGLPPTTQPGGDIDALVGTKVTVNATANVPARDPILINGKPPAEKRRVLASPPSHDPTHITAALTVLNDEVYTLQFRDPFGEPNRNPIYYSIRARPDLPPVIRVDRPAMEIELLADDVLPLLATAQDDYGVSRAALSYRRPGAQTFRSIELPLAPQAQGRWARIDERIALSRLNARPDEVIEWWVCVWDNREDLNGQAQAQQRDSPVHRLLVRGPQALARQDTPGRKDQQPPASSGPADNSAGEPAASQPGEGSAPNGVSMAGVGSGVAPDANRGDSAVAEATPARARDNQPPNQGQAGDSVQSPDGTAPAAGAQAGSAESPRTVEEFAAAHAPQLNTLARYLEGTDGSAQAPGSPQGAAGSGPAHPTGETQGAAGFSPRGPVQQQPQQSESRQAQVQAQEQGQEQGQGQDQGQGKSEEQGEGQGQAQAQGGGQTDAGPPNQAPGQGQSQGAGSGKTPGETPGAGGPKEVPPGQTSVPSQPAPATDDLTGGLKNPAGLGPQIPAPGRASRLMDALGRALRRGTVEPDMLMELGWDLRQAEQFVDQYQRLQQGGQHQLDRTELPVQTARASAPTESARQVVRANESVDGAMRNLNVTHQRPPDTTNQLMEAGRQRVPQRYRPLLEAYYRAATSQPAQ